MINLLSKRLHCTTNMTPEFLCGFLNFTSIHCLHFLLPSQGKGHDGMGNEEEQQAVQPQGEQVKFSLDV